MLHIEKAMTSKAVLSSVGYDELRCGHCKILCNYGFQILGVPTSHQLFKWRQKNNLITLNFIFNNLNNFHRYQ